MRISDWSSDVCSSDLRDTYPCGARWTCPCGRVRHYRGCGGARGSIPPRFSLPGVRHHRDVSQQSHDDRSEESRVGKECVSTCRSRWSPYHYKKNIKITNNVSHNN